MSYISDPVTCPTIKCKGDSVYLFNSFSSSDELSRFEDNYLGKIGETDTIYSALSEIYPPKEALSVTTKPVRDNNFLLLSWKPEEYVCPEHGDATCPGLFDSTYVDEVLKSFPNPARHFNILSHICGCVSKARHVLTLHESLVQSLVTLTSDAIYICIDAHWHMSQEHIESLMKEGLSITQDSINCTPSVMQHNASPLPKRYPTLDVKAFSHVMAHYYAVAEGARRHHRLLYRRDGGAYVHNRNGEDGISMYQYTGNPLIDNDVAVYQQVIFDPLAPQRAHVPLTPQPLTPVPPTPATSPAATGLSTATSLRMLPPASPAAVPVPRPSLSPAPTLTRPVLVPPKASTFRVHLLSTAPPPADGPLQRLLAHPLHRVLRHVHYCQQQQQPRGHTRCHACGNVDRGVCYGVCDMSGDVCGTLSLGVYLGLTDHLVTRANALRQPRVHDTYTHSTDTPKSMCCGSDPGSTTARCEWESFATDTVASSLFAWLNTQMCGANRCPPRVGYADHAHTGASSAVDAVEAYNGGDEGDGAVLGASEAPLFVANDAPVLVNNVAYAPVRLLEGVERPHKYPDAQVMQPSVVDTFSTMHAPRPAHVDLRPLVEVRPHVGAYGGVCSFEREYGAMLARVRACVGASYPEEISAGAAASVGVGEGGRVCRRDSNSSNDEEENGTDGTESGLIHRGVCTRGMRYQYKYATRPFPEKDMHNDAKIPFFYYNSTVVGGTFDHIHEGHHLLLALTALTSQRHVIVGLTDGSLVARKKNAHVAQSWTQRRDDVHRELLLHMQPCMDDAEEVVAAAMDASVPGTITPTSADSIQNTGMVQVHVDKTPANTGTTQASTRETRESPERPITIVPLFDRYGPSASHPGIELLILSEEFRDAVTDVNNERQRVSGTMMNALVAPLLANTDNVDIVGSTILTVEQKTSSTALRQVEADFRSTVWNSVEKALKNIVAECRYIYLDLTTNILSRSLGHAAEVPLSPSGSEFSVLEEMLTVEAASPSEAASAAAAVDTTKTVETVETGEQGPLIAEARAFLAPMIPSKQSNVDEDSTTTGSGTGRSIDVGAGVWGLGALLCGLREGTVWGDKGETVLRQWREHACNKDKAATREQSVEGEEAEEVSGQAATQPATAPLYIPASTPLPASATSAASAAATAPRFRNTSADTSATTLLAHLAAMNTAHRDALQLVPDLYRNDIVDSATVYLRRLYVIARQCGMLNIEDDADSDVGTTTSTASASSPSSSSPSPAFSSARFPPALKPSPAVYFAFALLHMVNPILLLQHRVLAHTQQYHRLWRDLRQLQCNLQRNLAPASSVVSEGPLRYTLEDLSVLARACMVRNDTGLVDYALTKGEQMLLTEVLLSHCVHALLQNGGALVQHDHALVHRSNSDLRAETETENKHTTSQQHASACDLAVAPVASCLLCSPPLSAFPSWVDNVKTLLRRRQRAVAAELQCKLPSSPLSTPCNPSFPPPPSSSSADAPQLSSPPCSIPTLPCSVPASYLLHTHVFTPSRVRPMPVGILPAVLANTCPAADINRAPGFARLCEYSDSFTDTSASTSTSTSAAGPARNLNIYATVLNDACIGLRLRPDDPFATCEDELQLNDTPSLAALAASSSTVLTPSSASCASASSTTPRALIDSVTTSHSRACRKCFAASSLSLLLTYYLEHLYTVYVEAFDTKKAKLLSPSLPLSTPSLAFSPVSPLASESFHHVSRCSYRSEAPLSFYSFCQSTCTREWVCGILGVPAVQVPLRLDYPYKNECPLIYDFVQGIMARTLGMLSD